MVYYREIDNKRKFDRLFDLLDFPTLLRRIRQELQFSRADVCDATGIKVNALIKLEQGEFVLLPKQVTIDKLAQFYDISVCELTEKCYDFSLKMQIKHKKYSERCKNYSSNAPRSVKNDI